MTFDQVMEFTRKVSSPTAFEEMECELFYNTLVSLPEHSTIVEVGVEYGRSTSLILQVAKARGYRVVLIDPFVDAESARKFMAMARLIAHPFALFAMSTQQAIEGGLLYSLTAISLLHIDGDHTRSGVTCDCANLLWRVDGYACFHDFGRESLPEVKAEVNRYVRNTQWEQVGLAGSLLVMRKR